MKSKSIEKLAASFLKFPSVGSRTASRFALYIAKASKEEVKELIESLIEVKKNVKLCSLCFNPFDGDGRLCPICSDPRRERDTLCVIEKESDLIAIEEAGIYQGIYFILGGTLSPVRKETIRRIRTRELVERIKNPTKFKLKKIEEIIIATNFTSEGETTALYLERLSKNLEVKSTRLARGLPKGGELEYIDEETISSAFRERKSRI